MKKSLLFGVLSAMSIVALASCGGSTPAASSSQAATSTTTATSAATSSTGEKLMTHAEFMAAKVDDPVHFVTYVQDKQSWWDNKATLYTQAKDGAYFVYNATCDEATFNKLVAGTKIEVNGFKAEWSGEVEVAEGATIKILTDDTYIATPYDATSLLGTDKLIDHQNELVSFKSLRAVAHEDGKVAWYKWDNSGSHDANSDLYFNLSDGKNIYSFTVESYLRDNTTTTYAAVEALNDGDTVDVSGFLYWYNGMQPHVTDLSVTKKVMTHAQFAAVDDDTEVNITTYVQDKQSWWDNKATLYTQAYDGAYFIYNATCDEATYNKLVAGTKVLVKGYKSTWSGEVEIAEASLEILPENTYVATAFDATSLLGSDKLIEHQNERVIFKNMKAVAHTDGKVAWYKYDNSGSHDANSDLYFDLSPDGGTTKYTFTVESYLRDNTTKAYTTVEGLKDGDIVDVEGFLYWYGGAQPHVTDVPSVID